jgi:hypothetical protein
MTLVSGQFEVKKISEYDSVPLADELMFLVEQGDGTYAYVLGSELSGGGTVDIGSGTQYYIPLIATTGSGKILTLADSPISYISGVVGINSPTTITATGGGAGLIVDVQPSYVSFTGLIGNETFLLENFVIKYGSPSPGISFDHVLFVEAVTGKIKTSSVTSTELGFLSGVTSSIQSQFTAIASTYLPLTGGTLVGNLNGVTPTELGYISGATSNLQNQINNINAGTAWKVSVRAATTANITLSGAQTIDGVSVVAGDRVLVKNQSTASQNGIYDVASGAWTRSSDANTGAKLKQATTSIEEGTDNADTIYTCTANGTITVGSTSLPFARTSATTYTGSDGVSLSGNNFVLDNSYFSGAFTLASGVATLSLVGADKGGTGVANNSASTWTISGNFGTTVTVTGTTSLTLPTTGTLSTLAGTEAFTNKTYNGNTWTSGSGTLTLAASSSLITTGAFATTFAASATATITLPATSATLLANNLGLSGGTTLIGGVTATGSIIFQDTSNSTNSLNTNHFIWKMTTAAGALEENLRMGNATGGEMNLYSMGNTTQYWLRTTANVSYFNAATDVRLQCGLNNLLVGTTTSISLRQATTMFTAMTFTFCAGTTTVAPYSFQSGTLKTTASQFAMEVSSEGQIFYSPAASQRNFVALWGYVAKTANYTATVTDYTIDCTANSFTVTLPTAGASVTGVPAGRVYVIKNSGAGTITIATTSSQTVDGTTPPTIAAGGKLILQSTGSNWITIG